MITPEFKEAYKRLNPEQKMAVDAIEGPVMVVAGPGTGKTEILTLRIANILLQTDTRPENILALTFTENAATNMRKRLASVIGSPAYRVRIQTFHSFCNDVLQGYPEYFPRIVGAKSITEVEATALIEGIIGTENLSVLRPWGEPLLYVGDILRKIEELKREGLSPDDFSDLVKDSEKNFLNKGDLYHEKGAHKGKMKSEAVEYFRKIEKNKELSIVYKKYQEKLFEKRLYDFSDMILEVLKVMEMPEEKFSRENFSLPVRQAGDLSSGSDPEFSRENFSSGADLKLILQEEFQYILVDEHQDTNNAQNKILELLADFHENPNIFIVGDHKQAVFRFQGASVENFLYFKKLYPKAELIDLFRNYRSTQNILDIAESLISSEKALKSENQDKKEVFDKIKVAIFNKKSSEESWIAERISEIIEDNAEADREKSEIAVIYRSNKEAFSLADCLRKKGIPFKIESDEDILSDRFVRKFIALINAVYNFGDDAKIAEALHVEELYPDLLKVYKLIRGAKDKKVSIYDLMSETSDFKIVLDKFINWARISKEENLLVTLEAIYKESGLLESMIKSKDADAFIGIERLFEEAKRLAASSNASLTDFVEYLEVLSKHDIFIKRPKSETLKGAVRLMTAHKAKGLEFDNVFIINASEKSFGGRMNRERLPLLQEIYKKIENDNNKSQEDSLDDERRLFYVAITRAKKNIFITSHSLDEAGKELLPSVFLSEIKKELIEEVDTEKFEKELEKDKTAIFNGEKGSKFKEIDKEFVEGLFYRENFSVTALNNYLDCPWKYFYRNLLRIPYFQAKYLLYGTAMHSAVEDMFKAKQKKEKNKEAAGSTLFEDNSSENLKNTLIDSFINHLEKTVLSASEKAEALEKGKKSLSLWFDTRNTSWTLPYKIEQNIWGIDFPGRTGEGIKLTGKLDKVELVDDEEVIVTDYKTGKVRSRNEIEGLTKNKRGQGNLKRQLIFYKLLLDLQGEGSQPRPGGISAISNSLNMTKGVIEFLEPNESGKIKFEEFSITKDEVEDLKNTIRKVAEEITSLSFWDSYCDEKECEYCGYRKLLEK